MKKIYSCDICRNTAEDPSDLFGLYFKDQTRFTLGAYGCTDGTHICYDCARQLAELLSNSEIRGILNI
jgi:hypothetical protein